MNNHVNAYIDELLIREGGYVDHPSDKGGPTNWGITEFVARAFGYTGSMRDLPRATAKEIYLKRYWQQPGYEKVNEVSPKLAEELFDTGVNMGTGMATMFLQRALNVLNQRATLFPDMRVDGALGNLTLAALQAFKAKRGDAGMTVLWRMLNGQQSVRYIELAESRESQEDFQFGWQAHRVGGAP